MAAVFPLAKKRLIVDRTPAIKRPLCVIAGSVLLLTKSVTLVVAIVMAPPGPVFRYVCQSLLFAGAGVWLYIHPRSARWLVGAFFAFATAKQVWVFPTFSGSHLDLIRRPFSIAIGAWLAWAFLFGPQIRASTSGTFKSVPPHGGR